MLGLTDLVGRAGMRAASMAAFCALALSVGTVAARAETRTLKFYNLHTKEKVAIDYKKNGRYIPSGMKQINWFLRDWRKRQETTMDPRLMDLIWEAYRQSGSRGYINVICGFRSPATNNMLRSRSSGVAKESQHTQGRALDFYIPDVPLKKMREIGLKMQVGGVGYYPRSGSPFVHFDVGNARHWPRMSRKELVAVFPNGNTIHVPSDGKPLPGYEQALASYKSRKTSSSIQVANAGGSFGRGSTSSSSGGGKTLFAAIFGGGADEEDDNAEIEVAEAAPAKPAPVAKPAPAAAPAAPKPSESVAVAAMVPSAKPNLLAAGVPLPIRDTYDTSAPTPPAGIGEKLPFATSTEVAGLDVARVPVPRSAPNRPAVAVPAPEDDEVSSLVAALESSPTAGEIVAGAPAQLAYAVPTPRERPPFEAILKGASPAVAADAAPLEAPGQVLASNDAIKRILDSAPVMRADVAGKPTAALPAARPEPSKKMADAMLVAAIESRKVAAATTPARSAAKIEVPAGKTGRFARVRKSAETPTPAKNTQKAITSRIEMAALVADPESRAQAEIARKPKAEGLVRNVPSAVFTAGFTANPLTNASDRFAGSAVNFLPVAKFE